MKKARLGILLLLSLVLVFSLSFAGCSSSNAPAATPPAAETPSGDAPSGDAPASDSQEDWVELNLNYATYLPETNLQGEWTVGNMERELEKVMPGKITITKYYAGTLLGQSDIYDGVLNGTCDLGQVEFGTVQNRFPLTHLWSLPGVLSNTRMPTVNGAFQEWAQSDDLAEYDDAILIWGSGNGPMLLADTQVINTPADVKGRQYRASATTADIVKSFGGTPVTMDISEVYEAIRNGLLNGTYTTFTAYAMSNFDEVAPEVSIIPLNTFVGGLFMNKGVLERMPQSQADAFMAATAKAFEENITFLEDGEQEARPLEAKKKANVQFIQGAELEEFRTASASVLTDYMAELDAMGFDSEAELQRIQDVMKKWDEKFPFQEYIDNFFPE